MNPTIVFENFTYCCFQENRIGHVIEDFVDHEVKLRCVQVDTTKNFNRLPFSGHGYNGLTADARPRSVQGWVLPKTRLVLKNYSRFFIAGFFLIAG